MVSVYPCELHGMRIRGALEGFRVTLLFRDRRASRKLRVCPGCLSQVLEEHVSDWCYVSDEGLSPGSGLCLTCGRAAGSGERLVPAFVYVWRRGTDQAEYYGEYCEECASAVRERYGLLWENDLTRPPRDDTRPSMGASAARSA